MVLCALYIYNEILVLSHSVLVGLLRSVSCEFKYFLLGDRDGIGVIQASQLDVLQSVIIVVNLVKNLPSDIEFHSLSDYF